MGSVSTFNFVLFFLVQCWCLPASALKTYIVHMEDTNMPSIFSKQSDWYSQCLQSLSSITDTVIPLIYSYTNAFTGFAAPLSDEQVQELLKFSAVLGVFEDMLYHLQTTRTPHFLGLETPTGLWEGHTTQNLNQASQDVIIGVLDSGVWPESPSFNDAGMPEIPARWRGECETSPDFPPKLCNKKLIGARSFSEGFRMASIGDTQELVKSARDLNGHGTHTASTAAGSAVANASLLDRWGRNLGP
ncbi:Subtilisin-like protease SBT1.8, partial [Mucuna pruriens]